MSTNGLLAAILLVLGALFLIVLFGTHVVIR